MNLLFAFLLSASGTGVSVAADAEMQVYPVRDATVVSLDGMWDFRLGERRGTIRVPGNWETQGWAPFEYDGHVADMKGVYARTFVSDPSWTNRLVFLRFDGVQYAYDVNLNGVRVATDVRSAYNLHQFDITEQLRPTGTNELTVTVRTRGKGWKWDACDDWTPSGIQRSVELFTTPRNRFVQELVFTGDSTGAASVRVHEWGEGGPTEVCVRDGERTWKLVREGGEYGEWYRGRIDGVRPWTAETPNLYRLEVTLGDGKGAVLQRIVERVGFRDVRVDGFRLLVNGRPIFFRGACLNEIEPFEGRTVTEATFRRRLAEMKRANVNAVRTAHYPFSPKFYDLCDEMGFYVVDECPITSYGWRNRDDRSYLGEIIDRCERTVCRDRNHPSVIVWTVGNENEVTDNLRDAIAYVKRRDPSRVTGFPQTGEDLVKWYLACPESEQDLQMGHYVTGADAEKMAREAVRPVVQTEFGHSMGEGCGEFEASFLQMRREPKLIGGFVWNWRDQAVVRTNRTYDARRIVDFGIRSVYRCGYGEKFGMEGPASYVFNKLLDDPTLDPNRLVEEFCDRAFGPAGKTMKRFYDTLDKKLRGVNKMREGFESPGDEVAAIQAQTGNPNELMAYVYSTDTMRTMETLLKRAERTANLTEKHRRRLTLVRLEYDYAAKIATVAHLYAAYRLHPTIEFFQPLGFAVKDRRAYVESLYDEKGLLRPIEGWPELGVFGNARKRELTAGGYLQAILSSPFGWDVDFMIERGILPGSGVRKQRVTRLATKPSFDDFEGGVWEDIAWNKLEGIQLEKVSNTTKFKIGYDSENLYLAVDTTLADAAEIQAFGHDGDVWTTEALEFTIDPFGEREKYYHFIYNPAPASCYEAAFGFIEWPEDPLYNNFDPRWNGKWFYETKRGDNHWRSLVTVPFASLGVPTPEKGAKMCFNIAREGGVYGQTMDRGNPEQATWSPNLEDRSFHSREAMGELTFE